MSEMNARMIELAKVAQDAAYEYWKEYQKVYGGFREGVSSAVVWLRNDETGHLLIFTRGEYSKELLLAIPK